MKKTLKIIWFCLYWILVLYLSFIFLDYLDSKKPKNIINNPTLSWNQSTNPIEVIIYLRKC
jgi:hypothetical protein